MIVVGVADMKVSNQPDDVIVTYALGSCLGVVIHDAEARVGGLLHAMLPLAEINPEKARSNPAMFIDTGVPLLFKEVFAAGATKRHLKIYIAGGAGNDNFFAIGERNVIAIRKILWRSGYAISGQEVGGTIARTMHLEINTGKIWIKTTQQRES
jgi:chemotaxis protein CheD